MHWPAGCPGSSNTHLLQSSCLAKGNIVESLHFDILPLWQRSLLTARGPSEPFHYGLSRASKMVNIRAHHILEGDSHLMPQTALHILICPLQHSQPNILIQSLSTVLLYNFSAFKQDPSQANSESSKGQIGP